MNTTSRVLKLVGWSLLIVAGVFMFVYGGYDDSPGAQGLGLLMVIVSGVMVYKNTKRKSGDDGR